MRQWLWWNLIWLKQHQNLSSHYKAKQLISIQLNGIGGIETLRKKKHKCVECVYFVWVWCVMWCVLCFWCAIFYTSTIQPFNDLLIWIISSVSFYICTFRLKIAFVIFRSLFVFKKRNLKDVKFLLRRDLWV